jgi:hypothetical protein
MAKHKSPQELMAERNPLGRKAVAPVDIYSEQPVQETTAETAKNGSDTQSKPVSKPKDKQTRPSSN